MEAIRNSIILLLAVSIILVKVCIQKIEETRLACVIKETAITQVPVFRNSKVPKLIPSDQLVVGDLI